MTNNRSQSILERIVQPLPDDVLAEAHAVAAATANRYRTRPARLRWTAPAVLSGAILLTAGAGTATVTMLHWAGVGMPIGNIRNETPIAITWTDDTGVTTSCAVWVEVANPLPGDAALLDQAVQARDWTTTGQSLYDNRQVPTTEPDDHGWDAVSTSLEPVLQAFASDTFPDIAWLSPQAAPDATDGATDTVRSVEAWGARCDPGTE